MEAVNKLLSKNDDLLEFITTKNFNNMNSCEKKHIIDLLFTMRFHVIMEINQVKKNPTEFCWTEIIFLEFGINNVFFKQKPDKLFERNYLVLKDSKCGVDSDRFDEENVLVIDKLVDYRYNTKNQWEVSDQHSSDVKVWAIWKV